MNLLRKRSHLNKPSVMAGVLVIGLIGARLVWSSFASVTTDLPAIPDTAYAIPTGAVFMSTTGNDSNAGTISSPVKSLNKAVSLTPSGGTVVIRGGLYRDGYRSSDGTTYGIAGQAITFQAYPHEQVWFDGTDIIAAGRWTSDGAGHWYMDWNTPSFCENKYYNYNYNAQPADGPCSHSDMYGDPSSPAAGDPQLVYIDDTYVHEVTSLAAATSGNFYYDWAAKRIYISSDPNAHQVELASRPVMLVMGGSNTVNVKILGIGVRRFATNENSNQTSAAITLYGSNLLIENSVFTQMAGGALFVGATGSVVRNSQFINNGYDGIQSNGSFGTATRDNLLLDGNTVMGNNTEKFGTGCSASCGQGGVKLSHMNGFTAKNNVFDSNFGHGFWCDLACNSGIIVDNVAKNNQEAGLFYEVSDTGIIASNLVYGNGDMGIRVASANTKIYNNTLVNNGGYGDIWIYDDPRSPGVNGWTDVGPDTSNLQMANNIVSSNNPTSLERFEKGYPTTQTNPEQFFSLLDYDSYYRSGGAGQTLVSWQSSTQNVNYTSLSSFTTSRGFEVHGQDVAGGGDPFFVDAAAGDFRVRSGSVASGNGTPIPSDVAAAIGVNANLVTDRGALAWPGRIATAPAPAPLIGDINGDGHVSVIDLSILLNKWATADSGADLNKSGLVDIIDLSLLLSHWTG